MQRAWRAARCHLQNMRVNHRDADVGAAQQLLYRTHIVGSLRVIGTVSVLNPLHRQAQEKSIHHRVVPTIALAAHSAHQAMFSQ